MTAGGRFARVARLVDEARRAEEWAAFAREARAGFWRRWGAGDYKRCERCMRAERIMRAKAERKRMRAVMGGC